MLAMPGASATPARAVRSRRTCRTAAAAVPNAGATVSTAAGQLVYLLEALPQLGRLGGWHIAAATARAASAGSIAVVERSRAGTQGANFLIAAALKSLTARRTRTALPYRRPYGIDFLELLLRQFLLAVARAARAPIRNFALAQTHGASLFTLATGQKNNSQECH